MSKKLFRETHELVLFEVPRPSFVMIREIGTDLNILFCYLSPVDREVQVGTEVQKFIFRDRESASSDRHQSPWARGQLKLSPAADKQVH